ncbi:presequence protease, mitochondrial [Lycorma delicatula]|uniref:presequence protease, mitochondrial n=1 Tax=Lycorma delicatula TaxID=130591 RepID=UPI003F517785
MFSFKRATKIFTRKNFVDKYRYLVNYKCLTGTKLNPAVGRSMKEESLFKEGLEIEGFTVTRKSHLPEFYVTAIQLRHINTGAEYLHLSSDDTNNAFSIGLRTTPLDSTGVPHILEHLCTCGSEKYPCRDPYFKMLSRSMATFMNAMTGPDYTIYPFSTQNHRDYMNLMSVYLDATLRPLLRKTDFSQEGWRLEHTVVDDPNTPIVFKGVVFNEMKGVFSDNQNIFYESLFNNMLPSHTYSVVSGGDPLEIPKLTYEALKEFHRNHYHPSNAKFYSYGNFPLKDTLKFINDQYLASYGKIENRYWNETQVPSEPRWSSCKQKHIECRFDNMTEQEKQSSIAIGHLCSDIENVNENFNMNILSELLVSGPNSPFYKSLVEPNIAAGFSPVTGYTNSARTTFFSAGLQGINPKDFDWFIDTYNKTINDVISKGFDKKNVDGILHNIELGIKHQTSDFGLSVLFSITTPWMHDADIIEFLSVNKRVSEFKEKLKDNHNFLQDCVVKYLRDNPHRLTLSMSPAENYDGKLLLLEENLLRTRLNNMPESEIKMIYEEGLLLRKEQEKADDGACLPTIKVLDLRKDVEKIEIKKVYFSDIPVQVSVQPTNGVAYFYGTLDVDQLSSESKKLLPLFCYVASKMGTPELDFRKFDQEIQLATRGLNFSYHNSESLKEIDEYNEGISMSSHCLSRNAKKMFQLWSDVFSNADGSVFNNKERFQTLVSTLATSYLNSVAHNGHLYAMVSSASLVSSASTRKEVCGGMTFVKKLKMISQPSEIEKSIEIVKDIASLFSNKQVIKVALNLPDENKDEIINHLSLFCQSLGGANKETEMIISDSEKDGESKGIERRGIHHIIPAQVSYASKSLLTVPYSHEDYAALRVLTRLVTMKYCLPEIREKGGAYGAGLKISSGGVLSFYSYRDPNPQKSFNVFDECFDWLIKRKITEQDVEEAKLSTFQMVDVPVPPGEKGIQYFLHGLDEETLEKHRLALMAVTSADLLRVASEYLHCDKQLRCGRSLIGPVNNDVIKRSNELWTVLE